MDISYNVLKKEVIKTYNFTRECTLHVDNVTDDLNNCNDTSEKCPISAPATQMCIDAVEYTHLRGACGDEVDTCPLLDNKKTSETKNSSKNRYKYKIIESGKIVEIYAYHDLQENINDINENHEIKHKDNEKIENVQYKRSISTINATKRGLKRLINANIGQYATKDKFITLTFKEFKSREEVIKCFKNFNKRLRYKYKTDYKYIAIIERGSTNTKRLHLHCLFFNLPYIHVSTFQKLWKYGIVNMKAIDDDVESVSNYMLKYVTKTLYDEYIPKGKKFYITSLGLKKPTELKLETENEFIDYINKLSSTHKVLWENSYDSMYIGAYDYIKIDRNEGD